ncbi:hypothetical protein SAMN05421538_103177 [Paracoccus isoporae]|uniref:Flagellar assembly protein FliH n=1 Tax=Paracoccus isoporae TaxID=591205 RepID=A0A1G6Z9C3_9RHOB|nr:hypothetical protein [Paracoccus isoporae]SDD98376.1 hypothetical protein SAMN05421538_103177 [Paracoccus isoporae]
MSTAQRFEDFSAAPDAPAPVFGASQMAEAYRRGVADGEARANATLRADLLRALQDAARQAQATEELRQSVRRETLDTIYPVLSAVTDLLAAEGTARLLSLLRSEIDRVVLSGATPICRIDAPDAFIALLGQELERAGLDDVQLHPHDRTEIRFHAGRIEIDQPALVAGVRAILSELHDAEES